MKKILLLATAALLSCGSAMAETVTFDFNLDNPWDWNSIPKNSSGYIDASAVPVNCVEAPVTLSIDGKFRRYAQQALGGTICLLMYQDTSLSFTTAEGYKMTEITFYGGTAKFADLAVKEGETELPAEEPTYGDGWNHTSSGAHIDEVYRMAYCNTAGPIVFYNPTNTTNVVTKIEVTYEASSLKEAGLAWSKKEFTAFMNEDNTFPTLSKATDAAIDYVSDNEEVASIDATTGVITLHAPGTAKIIAGCDATDTYDWGEASYILTVKRQGQITAHYNFTEFADIEGTDNQCIAGYPDILVTTWWTTNPDTSYGSGTQFKPLTIYNDGTEITFNYDGTGGHGNVRGTTTTKQQNLQLGSSACMTIKGTAENARLYEVKVQGNRKTSNGSMLDQMTTNDEGEIEFDEENRFLTWTPKTEDAVCYLDAEHGAYIETITVEYHLGSTGVGNVAADSDGNAPAEYFNIQGMRVDNPEKGLYICRKGSKVTKIVIQ
ncbi:MAG: hypothetical protein HDS65_02600 [Bacteroidales bacterium]|nr:hypothetical protein [Bacteroidales bacterium]